MKKRIKSLIYQANNYKLSRPRLYDFVIKLKRLFHVKSSPLDRYLNKYSRENKKNINFVQIGASDGLRNDPVREFIIRDKWRGVMIEPIPYVFELLKKNYEYISNPGLVFVNAAIVESNIENKKLFTIKKEFLEKLPLDRRLSYLQKSSFQKEHVERFSKSICDDPSDAISAIEIPCLKVNDLKEQYFQDSQVDLFIIDVEGYDASIIKNMCDNHWYPKKIMFETLHMGEDKEEIYRILDEKGYKITEYDLDAIATLENI